MTYAGQPERGFSRFPTYPISRVAAVIAALVAAGILALVAIQVLGLQRPLNVPPSVLVLAAEGRWELQHKLASGDLDLQRQAEREWESQRRQVSLALS